MNNLFSYPGLQASTIVSDTNSSYFNDTHLSIAPDPISGSTMGVMMLLSTLQYQAPYMGPMYSGAAGQAGKAALIESGGQAFQDKFLSVMGHKSKDVAHSIGITDGELGATLGTLKVIRDRQINLSGPRMYSVKTDLTINQSSGSMNFKYEW